MQLRHVFGALDNRDAFAEVGGWAPAFRRGPQPMTIRSNCR